MTAATMLMEEKLVMEIVTVLADEDTGARRRDDSDVAGGVHW